MKKTHEEEIIKVTTWHEVTTTVYKPILALNLLSLQQLRP